VAAMRLRSPDGELWLTTTITAFVRLRSLGTWVEFRLEAFWSAVAGRAGAPGANYPGAKREDLP
jgi:hypothetical protein